MIHITNTIRFNKSFDEFLRIHKNRYQTFGEDNDAVPRKILTRIGKEKFKDEALTNEEVLELKQHIENKIKELLSTRVFEPNERTEIEFLGHKIGLNGTPFGKNIQDNRIDSFYRTYKICEECLQENKPVYLSITEEND